MVTTLLLYYKIYLHIYILLRISFKNSCYSCCNIYVQNQILKLNKNMNSSSQFGLVNEDRRDFEK